MYVNGSWYFGKYFMIRIDDILVCVTSQQTLGWVHIGVFMCSCDIRCRYIYMIWMCPWNMVIQAICNKLDSRFKICMLSIFDFLLSLGTWIFINKRSIVSIHCHFLTPYAAMELFHHNFSLQPNGRLIDAKRLHKPPMVYLQLYVLCLI